MSSLPRQSRIAPMGILLVPLFLLVGLASTAPHQDTLAEDAAAAVVLDCEGTGLRRGVLEERWSAVGERTRVRPGDWLKTGARGAHAMHGMLDSGARWIAGPGSLVEVLDGQTLRPSHGEFAILGTPEHPVTVRDRNGNGIRWTREVVLRVQHGDLETLDHEPAWLRGYRADTSTEAMGTLLAQVDGRDLPLSVGYYNVTVDIRDQIARTVVEESFLNHTNHVLEGVFYFPLPADASISSFAMWIGNERVEGEIVEKQRAREIYETILREKRDPGLLEWAGGNLFKARVYPIGREKRIRLSYTQVLPLVNGEYRYHHALQSELLQQNPLQKLRWQINVASTAGVGSVECPSHPARIRTSEHGAVADFEAEQHVPDRDLELVVRPATSGRLIHATTHRRGEDGYFMVMFEAPEVPQERRVDEPLNLVILADTSGSLDGPARPVQVEFIEALLESLSDRDRFNLVTCDTIRRWAFDAPVAATRDHRQQALQHFTDRAPLGWSDLPAAFDEVLAAAAPGSHVIYVGDGVFTAHDADAAELARRLRQSAGDRVTGHAVVPGALSDTVVLQAFAANGPGTVRTIAASRPAMEVATELLGEVAAPAVENLQMHVNGLPVAAVHPARLPALPAGSQQIVVGRYDPDVQTQAGEVVVTGVSGGRPFEVTARLDLQDAEQGNSFLPRLWARRHLDHLIASGNTPAVQEAAITLSEDFQILTPWTSFLVLESEADRERFKVQKRFRMRDGEEFFAEGREDAHFELRRDQMNKARAWRLEWKRAALEELAGMGRNLTLLLLDTQPISTGASVGSFGGGPGAPRGGGGMRARAADNKFGSRRGQFRGPLDSVAPASDEAGEWQEQRKESENDDRVFADEEEVLEELVEVGKKVKPSAGRFNKRRAESKAPGPMGPGSPGPGRIAQSRAQSIHNPLKSLFPSVGAPSQRPSIEWPEDVRALLDRLDRTPVVDATEGGWRFRSRRQRTDRRDRTLEAQRQEWLLARDAWWTTSATIPGRAGWILWLDAEHRGQLSTTWDLARVRDRHDADRTAWSPPLAWSFGRTPTPPSDGTVRIEAVDSGTSRIVYETPDWRRVVDVDLERDVVTEIRFFQKDELQSREVLSEFQQIGGVWWPTRLTTHNLQDWAAEPHAVIDYTIEVLDAARFTATMNEARTRLDGAIILGDDPADQPTALASFQEQPTLENTWFLLGHYTATQQWDRVEPYLQSFLSLAGDRFGTLGIRVHMGAVQRRGIETREVAHQVAAVLAGGTRDSTDGTARALLAQTQQVLSHGNERLELLRLLEPVFLKQPPVLDSEYFHGAAVATALAASGRRHDATMRRRDLAARFPWVLQAHTVLASDLQSIGNHDEGVEWLQKAIQDHGPWTEHEHAQLQRQITDLLWNSYQLDRFIGVAERWREESPDRVTHQLLDRLLTAMIMTRRDRDASERIGRWLSPPDPSQMTSVEVHQFSAALGHALGYGTNLYRRGRYRPEQITWLVDTTRRFRDQPETVHHIGRILSDYNFRRTDEAQALLQEIDDRLRDRMATADVRVLSMWMQWLRGGEIRWRDREVNWSSHETALLARWRATDDDKQRATLEQMLNASSAATRLVFLRESLVGATTVKDRRDAAWALLQLLLTQPAQPEGHTEFTRLFTLLTDAHDPTAAPNPTASQIVVAAHQYTDWVIDQGSSRRLAEIENRNELSRRALKAAEEKAGRESREEAALTLAGLEDAMTGRLLEPWVLLDRVYVQVRLKRDLPTRHQEMQALLAVLDDGTGAESSEDEDPARTPDVEADWRRFVATTRALTVLGHLAAEYPEHEWEAPLYELLKTRHDDEFTDARHLEFVVMLARDRVDRLREQLTQWSDEQEAERRNLWLRRLAHLEAEAGNLEIAVQTLESAGGVNDLSDEDLQALSGWLTALDRQDAAREALIASYRSQSEWEIANHLSRMAGAYQRRGEGVPAEFDPEAANLFTALFRKAAHPSSHFWVLRNHWNPTKDFRLLECVPEAVLGHTPQSIYGFLERVRSLFESIDEATVDRMVQHLNQLRSDDRSALDLRALSFLEFMVETAAARQSHGTRDHERAAIAALEGIQERDLEEGEPVALAEYLADLGRVQPDGLGQAVVALLRRTYGMVPALSEERLWIAADVARAEWNHDLREEAIRTLQAARAEDRSSNATRASSARDQLTLALSRYLVQAHRHEEAEALWFDELEIATNAQRRRECQAQLARVYESTLQTDGRTSLGEGAVLYGEVRDRIVHALKQREDERSAENLVQTLCRIYQVANSKELGDVTGDVTRFAFRDLPVVLELYQYRRGQRMVGHVLGTLSAIAGSRTGIEFLVTRAENEPAWLLMMQDEFWRHHGYSLATHRSAAGKLDESLETRILAIALTELRRDLTSGQARQRAMYDCDNEHFWAERRDDFLATTLEVLPEVRDFSGRVTHLAWYLFHDLDEFDRAIDILMDADRRDILDLDGLSELVSFLHSRSRFGESVPLCIRMIAERPADMGFRTRLMTAYFHLDEPANLAATADAAKAWFVETGIWNEPAIAALARGCHDTGLHERAVTMFDEAIALRVRNRSDRGNGDGTLSDYYARQAVSYGRLGQTVNAVNAAAGAVVAWGRSEQQRGRALGSLHKVLAEASDLNEYAEHLEREIAETGLENPIVRKALGHVYFERRDWTRARHHLERAIEVRPEDEENHRLLIRVLDQAGHADEAAARTLDMLRHLPRDVAAYRELGGRYQRLEQPDAAERAHTHMIEMLTEESESHQTLARIREEQDRWDEADRHWRHVIRIRRDEPTGYLGLGGVLRRQDRSEELNDLVGEILGRDWPDRFGDVHGAARELLIGSD